MYALPLALVAFIFYIAAASWQGLTLFRRVAPRDTLVRGLGAAGLLCHLPLAVGLLDAGDSLQPGFSTSVVLAGALAVLVLLLVSLFKPVLNVATGLFPLAGAVLLLAIEWPSPEKGSTMTPGIALHALSAALAFALLAIAAVQAVLLGVQNQALRHHHIRGVVQSLPPLTTMERVLFELLWGGMILLTLSIASGFAFVDNMFAQHLVHKTVLSLVAWVIFAALLTGHHRLGWRGMRAVRWTLGGYLVLLLAYFGSKFVLEILLARP
ncbi:MULTISPECIES: cytochrome C assembly family protein [Halomonas]|uniref:Inner membrane protein YpjD n=2 Tax=Halomonas TaxID=2745 RepID=A0ABQ0U548_9GAMM|nr:MULTISPECIES: cytochrome c biogenesis protein CcsA [Halomonas]PSJ22881.1 cytochrome C biogenesis protein [Halomonas sp. ND22Bw]KGE79518.1 cytochrome C biogenesis protein [Halomonas salina]MDR5889955.1 cytochrome c biogenesis protein CcsA [Halomonas salina]RAH39347.1 cytochrome C biogenesis protein [Halomonas sp. SL1]WJY06939.1 cytochrome c biogenesis protein CcsA [Halomonas halophila]